MSADDFTLNEFRKKLVQVLRTDVLQKMKQMLAESTQPAQTSGDDSETEIRRMVGVIDSMTPQERQNPNVINVKRRDRIARGAGVQDSDVRALIKQFELMAPVLNEMMGKASLERQNAIVNLSRSDRWRFGI